MLRKTTALICLSLLIGGCAYKAVAPMSPPPMDKESGRSYATAQMAVSPGIMGGGGGSVSAASRYLMVRQKLVVVAPGAQLAKSLEAVIAFCGTIQCEVISSNITSQTGELAPSGSVSLRVRPGDVDKLIAFVGKQGKVTQHTTETEDKTTTVVDTDARIKNLTEFRDNLRKMLARPAASVSAFKPIGDAVRESASVLAESLASLITAVVAVIPWLIVMVPGGWYLVKAWRRMRRKRAGAVTPQAAP